MSPAPLERITETTALVAMLLLGTACNRQPLPPQSVPEPSVQTDMPKEPLVLVQTHAGYARIAEILVEASGGVPDTQALERRLKAISEAMRSLRGLKAAPRDTYAVANARVAWLLEATASELAQNPALAAGQMDTDLGRNLTERAQIHWKRCRAAARGAPPHIDAWDAFCRTALSARQSK